MVVTIEACPINTAHEWCRLAVQEKLNRDHGLSKSERILFEQFARGQYLITQGFNCSVRTI